MTILNWLEYNLQRDPSDNGITLQEILSKCNKDRFNCGLTLVDRRRLGRLVIKYFQIGISTKVMPNNILYSLKWRNHIRVIPFNIGNDTSFIKETGWRVDSTTEHALILAKVIDLKINNLNVEEKVEFRGDRWSLKINDRQVNLNDIDVDDRYITSQDGILTVLAVVDHISVCRGKELKVKFANNSIQNANLENINNTPKIVVNSTECLIAVPITCGGDTCPACKTVVENVKFLPHVPEKSSSECGIASDKSIADIKEEHNYANERSTDSHHDQPEENSDQTVEQTHKVMASILNNMDSPMQPNVKELHSTLSETLSSKKQSGKVKSSAIKAIISDDKAIIRTQKTAEPMTKNVQRIIKKQPNPEKNIFIPPELPNIDHVLIPVSNVDHVLVPVSTKNTEERIETMQQSKDHQSQSKHEEQYGLVSYVQGVPILKHGGVLPGKEQDSFCDVVIQDTELQPSSEQYIESLVQNILMHEGDDNDGTVQHIKDDDKVTQLDSVFSDTNMDKDDRDIHADYEDVKPNLDHELLSNAQSQATSKASVKDVRVYYYGQKASIVSDKTRGQAMQDNKTRCDLCNRNFRTILSLKRHIQTFKHFKCDICTSSFIEEIDLMSHSMTAHKIKVQCGFCNQELKSVLKMRNHFKKSLHFKCTLCPKRFETNNLLTKHSMKHSLKPFTCNQCSKLFTSEEDLNTHFNSAHRCEKCLEVFTSRQDLRSHVLSSHGLYTCRYCSKCFTSKTDFNTHLRSFHDDGLFKCDYCGRCPTSKADLNIHMRIHTGEKPYQCDACSKRFSTSAGLRYHKMRVHMVKTFICVDCNRAYGTKSELNSHRRIHTGEKLLHCQYCPKYFLQPHHLENHIRVHTRESPFMCEYCSKCFKQAYNLIIHRRKVHLGEKPYKCEECLKQFTQKSDLRSHIRLHTKEFQCEHCSKCFQHESSLVVHRRLHTGEKPYKCEQCPKQFALKHRLKIHMQLHTKEFQCEHCSKCFANEISLVVHRRLHTGEKPYKCEQCSKCFRLRVNLYLHKRIHSDDKPYKCEQCLKCFRIKVHLNLHKRVHKDEKPFKCAHCPSQFRLKTSLRKHLAMHTEKYKCKICLKCFEMKKELLLHTKTHIEDNQFKCSHCSRHFTEESSLIKHRKLHTEDNTYKCEHCYKQFKCMSSLSKHLKCHPRARIFRCEHCHKCFSSKKYYLAHKCRERPNTDNFGKKKYTKERPKTHNVEKKKFMCEHCSKVFFQREHFMNHIRIHTGEKPFQCEFCSQFFRQLITLMVHRRIHTGEKPFKCEFCPKSFRERAQLRNHRRMHTGEKPFKCEFCSKCFRVKASLRIHRKIHTGEKLPVSTVTNTLNKKPS